MMIERLANITIIKWLKILQNVVHLLEFHNDRNIEKIYTDFVKHQLFIRNECRRKLVNNRYDQ